MKRLLTILLILAMVLSCTSISFADAGSLSNFKKVKEYTSGIFTDIDEEGWYIDNVKKAYELGLMMGSYDSFNPDGSISIAEAITMAARLNSIYKTGKDDFVQGSPWYQVYVDYAVENGIIAADDYEDFTEEATREQFAVIFAKSLPAEALPAINAIETGMIPDVDRDSEFKDVIYMLYNAGILTGNDAIGSFAPETGIGRSSVAAIVTRMADKSLRKTFTLKISGLQDLFDRDYIKRSVTFVNEKLKCLFAAPNNEKFYIFSAPATDELREAYKELDVFDDDYEEKMNAFIASAEDGKLEDAANLIPSQAELDKYAGKTIGEFEADGFRGWGSFSTDDYLCFMYDNGVYTCDVEVDPESSTEDNEAAYVIERVLFTNLSSDAIEEPFDVNVIVNRVNKEKSIKAFYDNGFAVSVSDPDDSGVFTATCADRIDGKEYYYKAIFEFTAADKAEYERIQNIVEEDLEKYFEESEKFMCGLKVTELKDLTPYVPKQADLDKYTGKTLADLERDGFVLSEEGDTYAPYYFYETEYYTVLTKVNEESGKLEGVQFLMMK